MKQKELVTNMTKTPHVHYHIIVTDMITKHTDEKKRTVHFKDGMSLESCLNDVTSEFQFTEYQKHYAFYKNEATEYVRFEATLLGEHLKLTSDIYTCYCEPLNVNQDPPF